MAVERGAVDRALVPVENSLEGGVTATLDALAWDARDTVILGESVLAIRNCLIAREPIAFDAIEVVISHPQPLAQCARFLRTELRGAAVRAAASTADAVRTRRARAASRGPRSARAAPPSATAARCCARRSTTSRATRRASSGSAPRGQRAARARRRGRVEDLGRLRRRRATRSPGWLVRCLSEFAFRGVNLTKIESRPLRARLGHYLFHVDMEGRVDEPSVADAVSALRRALRGGPPPGHAIRRPEPRLTCPRESSTLRPRVSHGEADTTRPNGVRAGSSSTGGAGVMLAGCSSSMRPSSRSTSAR